MSDVVLEVVTAVVAVIALVVSIRALTYARRSAEATERQGVEAARAVQEAREATEVARATALREARQAARAAVPSVTVSIDSSHSGPAVLVLHTASGEDIEVSPPPEILDATGEHRLNYLGMRYRGVLRNDSGRRVLISADRGFFIQGTTDLRDERVPLPSTVDGHIVSLDPDGEALFEWFGRTTVIDWLELARAGGAVEVPGIPMPSTKIRINYAGDQNFQFPSLEIKLELERHPVFLPTVTHGDDTTALQILGPDGGVDCIIEKSYPRVPQRFEDLGEKRFHSA